jgi:pentatricopeptide repeat protein
MPSELQPYVGPRPFEREEHQRFFGREREASEMLSRVIAHPAVLLYSQSGAGKTSLLNASLIPLLEKEGFEILATARVRGLAPKDIPAENIPNLYVFNVLMSWTGSTDEPQSLAKMTIAEFLNLEDRPMGREGMPTPRVAVFDQFEELFTFYPERWNERQDFFEQVSEALERDRLMRIIFVMREDYIAELDPFVSVLPEKLRTRFRLERLREDAALEAVTEPLDGTGYSFAGGVAEQLVNNLLKVPVETASGVATVVGEFVEPVQLQVVCQTLWQKLDHSGSREITLDQLKAFGDVDLALSGFYETAILTVSNATGVNEGLLRRWFEHTLITPSGTRGTVFRGREETGGISNTAVDNLVDQHLIRGELRGGAHWYELTHDRLIEPIITSNRQWMLQRSGAEQTRQRLEKRAAEWVRNGRPNSGLLDEAELLEARRWLESPNADDVGYSEALFALVQASRAAVEQAKREQERLLAEEQRRADAAHARAEEQQRRVEEQVRSARRLRLLAAALAIMFLLAIATAGYAVNQSRLATRQTRLAQQKEQEAVGALQLARRETNRANDEAANASRQAAIAESQTELAVAEKTRAETLGKQAENEKKKAEEQALLAAKRAKEAKESEEKAKASEKKATANEAALNKSEGERLEQSGYPERAIEAYSRVASYQHERGESEEEAKTLIHIAKLWKERKEYNEAERNYNDALEIQQRIRDLNSLDLNDQAIFYQDIGKYDRAETLYRQAIAIRKVEYSMERDAGLAVMYRNLANLYSDKRNSKNDFTEAEQLYQQALRIQEKLLNPEDPGTVRTLIDLANTYRSEGKYIEAEPLFKRALAFYKADEQSGVDLATHLQRLASLYVDLGKYPEAVPLLDRVRKIQETLLYQWPAPTNFRPYQLALTLDEQGLINYYQGNYAKAEELYEKSLDIDRKQLEPSNTEIATMLHNLALTYFKEARYVESEQYEKESLAMRGESGNPDRLATSHSVLARLYGAQGKYAEAESYYELMIEERIKALGAAHPDLAIDQHYLAEFYVTQGRFEEARRIEKAAITVLEKSLGPANWRTSASLSTLATIYAAQAAHRKGVEAQRLYQEAETLYNQALKNLRETFGENHPEIAISLNGLAKLCLAQGRYPDAERFLKRAQEIQTEMLGNGHPDLASTLNNYGLLYAAQNKNPEAEQFYQRALEIRENKLGKEHPSVADTLKNYAALLRRTNRETEAGQMEARASAIRAKYPQLSPNN